MPANTPRALRWSTLAEHWVLQGHHVDVLCALGPDSANTETLQGVQVYRTEKLPSGALHNKLTKPNVTSNVNLNKPAKVEAGLSQKLYYAAKCIHDITWKKVYWPDYACLWYFTAKRKAIQLSKIHDYDCLISVSPPFTGHLVALDIIKKHPKTKWIVDIGDPFCFLKNHSPNNRNLYKKLNYFVEGKVLKAADAITVTTEPTSNKYLELFPDITSKIHIIPPLLSLPINQSDSHSPFADDSKIRLVFTGTLYKNIRNPDLLLDLFEELLQTHLGNKLELHFFGSIHDCKNCFDKYKPLLGNSIFLHGMKSHKQIFKAMKDADVLVNISNDTPYQLPSKIVEYASTGKPILNIAKRHDDISVKFLQDYPSTLILTDDQNSSFLEQTQKTIQFIEHPPKVDPKLSQQWLESFSIETIAGSYEHLIQNTK